MPTRAEPSTPSNPPRSPRSRAGLIVLVLSLLGIGFATLIPVGEPVRPLPTVCVFCGEYGGIDFTLNVILFVPYGVGLYLMLQNVKRAVLIAAATTLTIELLQLDIITGRDTSLGDLIANTLGASIGVWLTLRWRTWILPSPRLARRLCYGAFVVWIGLLCVSAWALRPSPTTTQWYPQITANLAHFGLFRGTYLDGSINGEPPGFGPLPFTSPTYSAFRDGRVTLDATVTTGWRLRSGTIAPILSIFDEKEHELAMFGQKGLSLVLRTRTHTSTLLMREPTVALSNVFPHSYPRRSEGRSSDGSRIGDTIYLSGIRDNAEVTLRAATPRGTFERSYRFHVFMLWNALLPFDLALGRGIDGLSALWAFGLIVLPVYWGALHAKPRFGRMTLVLTSVPAACLLVIPRLFGLYPSPWWAWLATALGGMLAWRLAAMARTRGIATFNPIP